MKKNKLAVLVSSLLFSLSLVSCGTKKQQKPVDPVTYTVTWVVEGQTVETDTGVKAGEMPHYDGATPIKTGTAEFSYSFTGWNPEVVAVTADATYTAVFAESKNSYTIKFMNGEEELQSSMVEYGEMPEYVGEEPTKKVAEEDLVNIAWYEFAGWDSEIVAVTGDATYTATFEPVLTHDLAYSACAYAVATLFGEEYVETFVKDEWESKGVVRFTLNIGTQMTPEAAGTMLDSLLVTKMKFTAISPIALDEESGYYFGTYLDELTGVVAYPLSGLNSTNTIIQTQFTHYNLLG